MFEILSEENKVIAKRIMNDDGFDSKEWIRWWSEDELQLDGDFSLKDLQVLVKIMEEFETRGNDD